MTREPEPTAFDAIVALWRAEGDVPQWPDDPPADRAGAGPHPDRPGAGPQPDRHSAGPDLDRHDPPPRDRPGPARDADFHADFVDEARTDFAADARMGFSPDTRGDIAPEARGEVPADPRADAPGDPRADARADPRADFAADLGIDPPTDAGADPRADRRAEDEAGADPHDAAGHDRRSERSTRPAGAAADPAPDEHFVPPEPPPLPRMGPPILVGLTLIGLGLVLVTFPGWVGVPQVYGLPLGLVAIAAGLGWLVLRLWPDPDDVPPPLYLDDPDDPDGGAVL